MTDWGAIEAKPSMAPRRIGKAVKDGERESPIQRRVVKALGQMGYFVAAVPNGAALGGGYMARVKQNAVLTADGLVDGFPDLIIIDRIGRVGFLEMKRPGGVVSADQERVHRQLAARGCSVGFAASLDDALAVVAGWGWLL